MEYELLIIASAAAALAVGAWHAVKAVLEVPRRDVWQQLREVGFTAEPLDHPREAVARRGHITTRFTPYHHARWRVSVAPVEPTDLSFVMDQETAYRLIPGPALRNVGLAPGFDALHRFRSNEPARCRGMFADESLRKAARAVFADFVPDAELTLDAGVLTITKGHDHQDPDVAWRLIEAMWALARGLERAQHAPPISAPEDDDHAPPPPPPSSGTATGSPLAVPLRRPRS